MKIVSQTGSGILSEEVLTGKHLGQIYVLFEYEQTSPESKLTLGEKFTTLRSQGELTSSALLLRFKAPSCADVIEALGLLTDQKKYEAGMLKKYDRPDPLSEAEWRLRMATLELGFSCAYIEARIAEIERKKVNNVTLAWFRRKC